MSVAPATAPPDRSSLSWRIFTAFMTADQITLTKEEIRSYVVDELKIGTIPRRVRGPLHLIVKTFLNNWSGWTFFKNQYLAGEAQRMQVFEGFQKYMFRKMHKMLVGDYAVALQELLGGLAADGYDLGFAPYAISIKCPAHMMNCYVFANEGEDIIMKQHLGPKWSDFTNLQLLNWPHIEVTFQTPDICIVRKQDIEFYRYLNFMPQGVFKYEDSVVEYTQPYGVQECYSYKFLEGYIKLYLETIKESLSIHSDKFDEIKTILEQFLQDVKDINVLESMVTNTAVLFRLSPVQYVRNKKLMKKSDKEGEPRRVGYCERITPKIQLLLEYFKAQQLDAPSLSFKYIEELKKSLNKTSVVLPQITFKCTFCSMKYAGVHSRKAIMKHLKDYHTMEQPVRCAMCKKQFEVLKIAENRWRHECDSVTRGGDNETNKVQVPLV